MKLDDRFEQAAVAAASAAARARQRLRLGDMLVAQNVISAVQLQAALDEQRRSGRKLGQILIEDRIADESTIADALAQQMKVPYVDLTLDKVSPRIARLLNETQARKFRALPIDEVRGVVRVGMADPTDLSAFDEIQRILARDIDLVVVTETRLIAVVDRLYGSSEETLGFAKELELSIGDQPVDLAVMPVQAGADDAPVVKLLQSLFDDALRAHASDIHVEPQEKRLVIRFRIDGALQLHTEAELRIAPAVVQRLKLIAGLDIAERRLPQDGRFVAKVRGQNVDMRISSMPTQYGEAVALRVLPQQLDLLSIDKLGMPQRVLERVHELVDEPHGMLLVTGPTGSGKTTTLYSVLAQMNSPDAKVVTVEDPVEYRLPGISQVQVHEKIGLTFATVLRSTLRHDPDIVLVGEMRDRDTVETGLRAAMTGHMVLSTLHTNDSASTPIRLADMGAPTYLIATSLKLVLAQRLVRLTCPHCAQPHKASAQEHAFLRAVIGAAADVALDGSTPLRIGSGCNHCNHTGQSGRHGVYELLDMTPRVVRALLSQDSNAYMQEARREIGQLSLAHHACELVLRGATTVREVMRSIGRVHDAEQ
ncbi:MAG TPA: GspE/PulE family protein [Burkholderiaceae bacterium]|nr:GspE/PulE family protein [Burkholderiaceae bacterium]